MYIEGYKTNLEGFNKSNRVVSVSEPVCKHLIDSKIYSDASGYHIPFFVVDQLHVEWHKMNGKSEPESLSDLLEVVC